MLLVNNLHQNGSEEQKLKYLPAACDGSAIGGMCMSEPGAGECPALYPSPSLRLNAGHRSPHQEACRRDQIPV